MADTSFAVDVSVEGAGSANAGADALSRLASAQDAVAGGAGALNSALATARGQLEALRAAAASIPAVSLDVAGGTGGSALATQLAAAVSAQSATVAALETELATLKTAEEGVGEAATAAAKDVAKIGDAAKDVGKGTPSINELKGSIDDLAGPLGGIFKQGLKTKEAFEEVTQKFGSGMATGLVAVGALAAAVIAFVAVLAIATAAAVGFGIAIYKVAKAGVLLADKEKRLEKIGKKLKSNYESLFSGLKIEKLLDQFDILADLFNENTAAGQAMKLIFEGLFQPLIDGAAKALPYVERGLLYVILYALKAYVAFKQFQKTDGFDTLVTVLKVIGVVVGIIVAGLVLLGAIVAVSIGAFVAFLLGAVAAIGALIGGVVALGAALVYAVISAVEWLSSLSLSDIATNLIDSLVSGIMAGVGAVVSAVTSLGTSAVSALKSVLQIASPSKVFAKMGGFTAEGFVQGVDAGAPDAGAALENLVSGDVTSAAPAAGGARGPITIQVNVPPGTDATLAQRVAEAVQRIFEGDVVMAGLGNA